MAPDRFGCDLIFRRPAIEAALTCNVLYHRRAACAKAFAGEILRRARKNKTPPENLRSPAAFRVRRPPL